MAAVQHKDPDGYHWIVNGDKATSRVDVWWNRSTLAWAGKSPAENLVLRQENREEADVIVLPLGMVYDLIDALNRAVMEP